MIALWARRIFLLVLCVVVSPVPGFAMSLGFGGGGGGGGGPGSITVTEIDGSPTGNFTTLKFSNGSVSNNGDGSATIITGAGGGGDFSSNTILSVDSELVLFSGTGGKTGKRSTGTGWVRLNNGAMLPAAELSGDCTTLGSFAITCTKLNGGAFAGTTGNLVSFGAGNTPADSGIAATNVATLSGANVFTGTDTFNNTMTVNGVATFTNATGTSVTKLLMPGTTSGTYTLLPPATVGSFKFPVGTTDLTTTGGATQVLKQTTVGGPLTTGQVLASDIGSPGALTQVSDINVTLTLGGAPSVALLSSASITAGWTGMLGLGRGGTASNLTSTGGPSQVLKQTSVGSAISVGQLAVSDISGGTALTATNDTNVTLTLGGTPATALLTPASLTLGWAGQLSVARGGTGANLGGTGGVSQVLKQTSTGAPVTVARLFCADLADSGSGCTGTGGGGVQVADATGIIGLTTVVGVSGNAMRSDAAPALSQAISPTWTGTHTFTDNSLVLKGATTGSTTLRAAPAAGSTSIRFPAGSTDFSLTGGTSQVVKQTTLNGPFSVGQLVVGDIGGGQALSGVNDTNVTISLSGTPATALLAPATIAMGWTGQLSVARGGTGASLTASGGPSQVFTQPTVGSAVTVRRLACADLSDSGTGCTGAAGSTTFADPAGTIGLSTVVGVATTAMRSDAAPPLSQAISPTWTGIHTFTDNSLVLKGATSGSTTLRAAAAAGSTSIRFPAGTTDFSLTGGTSQVVKQTALNGAFSVGQLAVGDISGGQALSAVNDTNVTMALSGTPGTALLAPATMALGWAGQLSMARGGTGANLSATGGASFVFTQPTVGAAVTVRRLVCADLTDAGSGCTGSAGSTSFADPSGTIGLTVVPGTALSAMRSDAAPPLSQAISPTWTGTHTFTDNSLVLKGATSGTTTLRAAPAAGSTNIRFPAGTTDFSATGGASQVVKQTTLNGAFSVGQLAVADISGGQALSAVNDTNVTLSLSGSPTTSLLTPATMALGWTGQLSVARGGTGATLAATGGTSQVLKQTTVGGAVTVGQLSCADLSNAGTGCSGAAGGGDFSTNTNTAVDSEIVLFSGTGTGGTFGKLGKRATGTGFARVTAGVFAAAEISGDCTTAGSAVITCTKLNGGAFTGVTGNIVSFGATNIPADSGLAVSNVATLSGADVFTNVAGINVKKLVMPGATSGTYTLLPPDTAGTGTFKFPQGATDLSTSGGPSFVVRQSVAAGPLSVSRLACADLLDAGAGCSGSGGGTLANPTATIGLSAINGVATTGMRSDAAPALSQAISPTWTGIHTFSDNSLVLKGATSGTTTLRAATVAGTTSIRFPNGSTDFSATGGASQVVQQFTLNGPLTVGTLGKADVGLGNVDNTSDVTKNAATVQLTNKQMVPRVVPVATSGSGPALFQPNADTTDVATNYTISGATQIVGPTATTGTPLFNPKDQQQLEIILKSAAPQTITWDLTAYSSTCGLALPAGTTGDGTTYNHFLLQYHTDNGKWCLIATTKGSANRVTSTTVATAPPVTFNCTSDTNDLCEVQFTSGTSGTITIAQPTGSPSNGDMLMYGFMCTAAQTLTWNAIFVDGVNVVRPPTCPLGTGTWFKVGYQYSTVLTKWVILGTN